MKKETKAQKKEAEIELRKNPINVFKCGHSDCEQLKAMTLEDFKKHVQEVHLIDPTKQKIKRNMISHIDGDYWFSYDYNCEFESGLKFRNYTECAREGKSKMYP
jgi:hypothetical protein